MPHDHDHDDDDDNQDEHSGHEHHYIPMDLGAMMQQLTRIAAGQQEMSKAGDEARACIERALISEYEALHVRAIEHDHLLAPDAEPNLEQASTAYALHGLAKDQARMIARMIGSNDMGRSSEFRAQSLEHRAASERWATKMARAVRLMERVAAATGD